MSEGITPALTPEEWAEATESDRYLADMVEEAADDLAASFSLPDGKAFAPLSRRHALAALALHGQPFGFTRDMRAALQRLCDADLYDCVADDGDGHFDEWCSEERAEDKAHLRAALDCISALLPPEDK